jgi:DNA polymerase-3 subunit beta
MKLTILQENLVKALTSASRVITTKSQMPVLNHIKMDADKTGLVISATDLEIGLKLNTTAQVEEPGTLTVPARVITELITNCGPGNLKLETRNSELAISGGGTKATISGMDSEEFPEIPDFTDDDALEIPSEQLLQAVNKVAFSAATEDSRPVLTAIQIKLTEVGMELAATDGYRLSWLSFPSLLRGDKDETLSDGKNNLKLSTFLIPARALQEVVRLIEPSIKSIKFAPLRKTNQVIFQIDHIQLVSRLISGDFPNLQKVMPDTGDTIVEMDRQELLRAMRLAAIFARESANIVKFNIFSSAQKGAGGSFLSVSANAPQVGGQESTVDVAVDGPAAQIAFNYRYILDFLNACTSPSVKLLMTTSLGPGLWLESASSQTKSRGSSGTALQYKHVIMPVRVESENS